MDFLFSLLLLFHLTSIPRNCVLWLKTVFHGCKSAALSVRFPTSVAIPGLCRTNMGSVSKLSGSGGEWMLQNCGGRKARNFLLCWYYIATSWEAFCLIHTAKYIDHNYLLWTAFYIISVCNVNSINANENTITQLTCFLVCFFKF